MLFLLLIIGVIFIYSTYAWFSSTLDVEIHNFNVKVDTENGLYISLDGIHWDSSVDISEENIIDNLKGVYGSNTNRWSKALTSVSTVGLLSYEDAKFTVFENNRSFLSDDEKFSNNLIGLKRVEENISTADSSYIAFDIFLKNVTNSPKSDNLYITNQEEMFKAEKEKNEFIIDAARLGIVFVGSANRNNNPSVFQNMACNPRCSQLIFEPSITHTDKTIKYLKKFNIALNNEEKFPTYAAVNEVKRVNIWSGVHNSGMEFNNGVFSYQDTVSNLSKPIYQIPDGVSKLRIYIWIEGQDIDIIRHHSEGYELKISINFEKDFAGYN